MIVLVSSVLAPLQLQPKFWGQTTWDHNRLKFAVGRASWKATSSVDLYILSGVECISRLLAAASQPFLYFEVGVIVSSSGASSSTANRVGLLSAGLSELTLK